MDRNGCRVHRRLSLRRPPRQEGRKQVAIVQKAPPRPPGNEGPFLLPLNQQKAPPERGRERSKMKNETFRRFWDAYFDWKLDGPEGFQGMNQQVPSSPKEDTPQVRHWTVLGQMNFVSTGQKEAHK